MPNSHNQASLALPNPQFDHGNQIDVRTFGFQPDTREDMVPAARRLLAHCRGRRARLVFPKGRYDFFPDPADEVTIAFHLRGLREVELAGGGAEFVFHGMMMPVRVEDSESIVLRDFSVDWDRPFISQGTIVGLADYHVDLAIDRDQYPYVVEDDRIWFTSSDWKQRRDINGYNNLYDCRTREIVYRTRDNPLRLDFNGNAQEIGLGVVRFYGRPACRPELGTYIALNHGRYIVKGIELIGSKNVTLQDLALYHVLSGGIVASRTENITIDRVSIVANEAR